METTTTIDLQPFCDTEEKSLRWSLKSPFVLKQRTYATDGRIAVSVPAAGEVDTVAADGKRIVDIESVFRSYPLDAEWNPWPEPNYELGSVICPRCDGSGAMHRTECADCCGSGETECDHCGSEVDCDACDGEGEVLCGTCPKCHGSESIQAPKYQAIPGLPEGNLLGVKYDALIRQLPNVVYSLVGEQVFFRFDGDGRGIVMPVERASP